MALDDGDTFFISLYGGSSCMVFCSGVQKLIIGVV